MKKIIMGSILTASVAFGSATIFKGTDEKLTFTSNPEGATVKINGIDKCTTPCETIVESDSEALNISIVKNGYETSMFQIKSNFQAGYFILDIFWDLGTTDAITGAWYEYAPDSYSVELKKLDPAGF